MDQTNRDLSERVLRVVQERVEIVPYDPRWPDWFAREKEFLLACLPPELIGRIEHFGSTAVCGLCAKPIVDILVEVVDLDWTRRRIVPILEDQGYEYFWRPSWGDDVPPFYAWFIKRSADGKRTHHIHMVERNFPQWEGLFFRDYLIEHPEAAQEYAALKQSLAGQFNRDRVAYTQGKTEFVRRITDRARQCYGR